MGLFRHRVLVIAALIAGIGVFGVARAQPAPLIHVNSDAIESVQSTRAILDPDRVTVPPAANVQASVDVIVPEAPHRLLPAPVVAPRFPRAVPVPPPLQAPERAPSPLRGPPVR